MKKDNTALTMVGHIPQLDQVKDDLDTCIASITNLPECGDFEKLYIYAAYRRTLSLIIAFQHAVDVGNEQMAATLLRLNLDTLSRFYALFWAEETEGMTAESFAKLVFDGEQINKMKLRNQTCQATDSWLISQIEPLGSWIADVYKTCCGAVHFSGFHMERVLKQATGHELQDGGELKVTLVLGGTEKGSSPDQYNTLMQAFTHICLLLVCAMQDRCGILGRDPRVL